MSFNVWKDVLCGPLLLFAVLIGGIATFDFAAFRNISLSERFHLGLRAEVFNPLDSAVLTIERNGWQHEIGIITGPQNSRRLVQQEMEKEPQ